MYIALSSENLKNQAKTFFVLNTYGASSILIAYGDYHYAIHNPGSRWNRNFRRRGLSKTGSFLYWNFSTLVLGNAMNALKQHIFKLL